MWVFGSSVPKGLVWGVLRVVGVHDRDARLKFDSRSTTRKEHYQESIAGIAAATRLGICQNGLMPFLGWPEQTLPAGARVKPHTLSPVDEVLDFSQTAANQFLVDFLRAQPELFRLGPRTYGSVIQGAIRRQ